MERMWSRISAEFMLLRPREPQKILVTYLVARTLCSLVICHFCLVSKDPTAQTEVRVRGFIEKQLGG